MLGSQMLALDGGRALPITIVLLPCQDKIAYYYALIN